MMMRVADRISAQYGLTGSRWMLMCSIGQCEDPPTIGALSEAAMLSAQNVGRMLASMEEEGLVVRTSRPGAGRTVFVELTDLGRDVLARTDELAERLREPFLAGFTEEDVAGVQAYLDRLVANLVRLEQEMQEGRDAVIGAAAPVCSPAAERENGS